MGRVPKISATDMLPNPKGTEEDNIGKELGEFTLNQKY